MASELNFREKGLSKPFKHRLIILIIIFIVAFVFFQIGLNRNVSQQAVTMDEATLPLVYIETFGQTTAQLHGYTQEMDALYMRDALVPLDENRTMQISVDTYENNVDSVSYEIQSLDTERKIADTTLSDFSGINTTLTTSIQVENLVETGEEYLFILQIHLADGETIYYYTRIIYPSNDYTQELLDFAEYFHSTAMSDNYEELSTYMETSEFADTDTLADVSIESSLDQVGWVGFDGSIVGEPLISITDINDDYESITYTYLMTDGTSYYNVEEYFKLRYTSDRIYVLAYTRTMDEILGDEDRTVNDSTLEIGITPSDKEYLANENGTIVAFVQAGELYEYNQNKQTLTRVFSFMDDITDARENYNQHNIRILNIDETGSMDFVVYGYMNRGEHEGECGINLYHYDSSTQEAIEEIFISSTQSYEILNANFNTLLYESISGDFYIMLGGTLAKVGQDDSSTVELVTGLSSDQYAVSTSGQYMAWIEEEELSENLYIIDLETEEVSTITAASGTLLRPLEFMDNDLVYGVVRESDISTDTAGGAIYPMYQIKIIDTTSSDFTVLKTYEKDGYYVISVQKDGSILTLSRLTRDEDGTYVSADSDTIQDTTEEQNDSITYTSTVDSDKGRVYQFVMTSSGDETAKANYQVATLAVTTSTRKMSVSVSDQATTYFVYVGNHISLTTQNLTEAISAAYEDMGVVIDNTQTSIWKRGRAAYVNTFTNLDASATDAATSSSAGCLSAMLDREGISVEVTPLLEQGLSPIEILERSLPDDAIVLDLAGCTLVQVLYYVSEGTPVYASTGDGEAVLIVGYDASKIVVYYATTDSYSSMSMSEATALFEENNNVFVSYID